MNFPDLETCRAIADEFPDSDFVWVDRDERAHEDAPGEVFLRVIGGGPLAIAWRRQTNCKIISPATTCEELGVWITSSPKMSDWAKKQTSHGIRQQIDAVIANLIADCAYSNKGETQARADAVALALKEAKK